MVNLRVKIVSVTAESVRVIHCPSMIWSLLPQSRTETDLAEGESKVKTMDLDHSEPPPYGVL